MIAKRWQQIEQLCHEALACELTERATFLDDACAGDSDLRREVESLIEQQSAAGLFLETPAGRSDNAGGTDAAQQDPVPLLPGTRLDRYEVVGHVASGGMGDVYEARDTRLGRAVAIKVLPGLATDPRRRRFEHEARAASALNHPHICTLHDIGADGDVHFLVMERLDGQTLSERLREGPLPLAQALDYAAQIAAALGAAHAHGIVHRDLKPANIMLTSTGAKLLDFGLAKLKPSGVGTASGARSVDHDYTTTAGVVFGTLPYMAPEQVAGKETDARTDLFAFGCVLYEMLAGRRPFVGDSDAAIIAGITLSQPPRVSSVQPGTPPAVDRLVERCLQKDAHDRPESARDVAEALRRVAADYRTLFVTRLGAYESLRKDPQRRFQHNDDVTVSLQEIKEEFESGTAATAVVPRYHRSVRIAAVAGSLILAIGLGTWLLRSPHETEAAALRVVPLTTLKGSAWAPAFSPDGHQVAFVWNGERENNFDIYVKLVGSTEVRRLTSDPAREFAPRWSPDGQEIAFVRGDLEHGTLHIVSPLGGADRKVSDFAVADGLDWSPDGHWIAAGHQPVVPSNREDIGGIYLIPLDGDDPRLIVQAKSPAFNVNPVFAPDGRRLVYASCQLPNCSLYLVELDAAYKPVAAPRQLTPRSGVGGGSVAWSRDGRSVIFDTADNAFLNYLWRVAADGNRAPERIEVAGMGASWPATVFSRDRLAFVRNSSDVDLYRFVAGQPPQVVAASSFLEEEAALSADGRRLAFTSARSVDAMQIWVSGANGSEPQQLTRGGRMRGSPSWSPDARQLAFDSYDEDSHFHIWIMDADGANRRQLTADSGEQNRPTWSRDGQWIYFSWGQGNQRDIWRMHPAGGLKERVTRGGAGDLCQESADGTHVLYQPKVADGPLMALPLNGGVPQQLLACVSHAAFAVAATGIHYVPCLSDASDAQLRLLDPDTGTDRLVGTLEQYYRGNSILTVSRDGQVILYGRGTLGSDLMLIENFR